MKGLALQTNCKSFTPDTQLITYCLAHNIPYQFIASPEEMPKNYVPYASVNFCEQVLGKSFTPNYFPDFISKQYIGRKYWNTNYAIKGVFIKPADTYKRFSGFIITAESYPPPPPYFCQDPIKFDSEFRQYVINGKILYSAWYSDASPCIPAPNKSICDIPGDFCGTLDWGYSNNRLLLVESHLPFSIGWYGPMEDVRIYFEFMEKGWEYMLKMSQKSI